MNPAIRKFGKDLREFINSDEVFSILPEGDWGAGGCWILARALKRLFGPPAKLWAVVTPGKVVQHVVVKYSGVFFDFLGAQTSQEVLENFVQENPWSGSVGLVPLTHHLTLRASEGGIPCEPKYVDLLAAKLKSRFGPHDSH